MENLPIPLSRVERFLAKACGMDVTTPEPGPGIEPFLYAIAYNTTPPVAGYRTEEWLAYVQGVAPAKPLELEGSCIIGNQKVDVKYFAVAAGMPGATLPEKPQNRKEEYWEYIATHRPTPGILKYATGTNIALTDVVRGIEELQYVYGDTFQQTYSGKNLFSGDYAQFDNTGGTGNVYNYFALPEAGKYTITLIAKNDITPSGTHFFGFMDNGGTSGGNYRWVFGNVTTPIAKGTKYSGNNTVSGTDLGFVAMYPKTEEVFDWLVDNFEIQLEAGSTFTDYEPYTGGIPSPNPDYPQDVQVVTGEQTVTTTGKNLCSECKVTLNGSLVWFRLPKLNSNTITLSVTLSVALTGNSYGLFVDGTNISLGTWRTQAGVRSWKSITFTNEQMSLINNGSDAWIRVYKSNASFAVPDDAMIEYGSSMTDFEPYQSQSYTINLGSTELCKIGDYQDYIYKSGDDWYVHKETAKIIPTAITSLYGSAGTGYIGAQIEYSAMMPSSRRNGYCNLLTPMFSPSGATEEGITFGTNNSRIYIILKDSRMASSSEANWNAWLASNELIIYYVLATPADTKITDATLVGQLNAIDSAVLPKPIAYITVGATDPNLPGPLKISYYGEEE